MSKQVLSKQPSQTKSPERVKELGEVFTPEELVNKMLNQLPHGLYGSWEEGKTFLDPSCGTGNFLVEVAKRKMNKEHKEVLSTIFGVDIMLDNVEECRARLLEIAGDTEENRAIVKRNIVCADALTYDFSFE